MKKSKTCFFTKFCYSFPEFIIKVVVPIYDSACALILSARCKYNNIYTYMRYIHSNFDKWVVPT